MNEDIIRGLTDKEIQERIDKKQVNFVLLFLQKV